MVDVARILQSLSPDEWIDLAFDGIGVVHDPKVHAIGDTGYKVRWTISAKDGGSACASSRSILATETFLPMEAGKPVDQKPQPPPLVRQLFETILRHQGQRGSPEASMDALEKLVDWGLL